MESKFLIKSKVVLEDVNGPFYEEDDLEIFNGTYSEVKCEVERLQSIRKDREQAFKKSGLMIYLHGTKSNIEVYELRECYILTDALLNSNQL